MLEIRIQFLASLMARFWFDHGGLRRMLAILLMSSGCSLDPSLLITRSPGWPSAPQFRRPFASYEPGIKTGVPLLVDNPKEIGADRIVNTLAAHTLYPHGPAIVVDFGTSTNLDVVSDKGEFLGGVLAPGIEISLDALAARAAQLRKVELVLPRSVIGKNTVEALQSGIIYGFAGQVDGLVYRITAELQQSYSQSPTVIATGGLAPLVLGISETIVHHEPDLTLIGLRLVHERNA
jgi:type III pantothenate kinase